MKKLMQGLKLKRQPGVTSLLLVIAVSLALTTIVAGIATLSIRELQQASNADLSNRAFQMAESAVRIVENQLKSNPSFTNPGCSFDEELGNKFNTTFSNGEEITCLKVQNEFSKYEANLKKDDATQLLIEGANLKNMELKWGRGGTLSQYNYSGELYPAQGDYNNAAGIEFTVAYWPKSGGYTTESIQSKTAFIMPGVVNPGPVNNPGPATITSVCDNSATDINQYACSVSKEELQKLLPSVNSGSYNYAFRIKPRYKDASFELVSYDTSDKPIIMKSNKAQIDVTAKVGDLYRRVKANVVIAPSTIPNLFDSVLYRGASASSDSVGSGICKDIKTQKIDGKLFSTNSCN